MNNREYDVAYVASFLMDQDHIPMKAEVFHERMNVCLGCEHRQQVEMTVTENIHIYPEAKSVDAEWKTDEFDICGHCGCQLEGKLMEWMSSCPINKWRFSYDDWVKHYLPLVKGEIERNGGSDFYWWEGVLESENIEENTDGE